MGEYIETYKELSPFKLIQGGSLRINMSYIDRVGSTDTPADISDYECWFVLCPWGQPNYVQLRKQCALVSGTTHTMSVLITSAESKELQGGSYVFEFVLKDINGQYIKNAEGLINIKGSNCDYIGGA